MIVLDKEQKIQEKQYEFPYHYIPSIKGENFNKVEYWPNGYRYIGVLNLIFNLLEEIPFNSIIDVGCGDGRLISEIERKYSRIKAIGVDYSERAIGLAKMMNPEIADNYYCLDITEDRNIEPADVITLIEVLEHIPPKEVTEFIKGVCRLVKNEGTLILTVPHLNKPLLEKHYQHFDSDKLREILTPYFKDIQFIPFDRYGSRILMTLYHFLGGEGNHFIISNEKINKIFLDYYLKNHLYTYSERDCGRIAVVCRNKIIENV